MSRVFVAERSEEQQMMDLLRNTLTQLSVYLSESKQQMIDEEEEETEQADWRFMAMVNWKSFNKPISF
jgi:hypothetical protein